MTEKVFRETILSNLGGPGGPHGAPIGPRRAPGEQISEKKTAQIIKKTTKVTLI